MNILKAIFNAVMGSPGKVKKPTMMSEIVRYRKRAQDAEKENETLAAKLKAAADALRQIECMTHGGYILSADATKIVHTLAQNAWREAK